MELYWHLPVRLQEAALAAYARRLDRLYYGRDFESWRREFEGWKNWTSTQIAAWQNHELGEIVRLAGSKIPYYREAWSDHDWRRVAPGKI